MAGKEIIVSVERRKVLKAFAGVGALAGVQALASIPSREELLAKLLGVMQAPVSGFVGAVAALAKKREQRFQSMTELVDEIKKVAEYYAKGQPIPWNRVHKVPDYVQFPHMRHVNAGVTCQSCHGQIQNQGAQGPDTNYVPVQQVNSLNMGWCVNCHIGRSNPSFKARYDCATCHY